MLGGRFVYGVLVLFPMMRPALSFVVTCGGCGGCGGAGGRGSDGSYRSVVLILVLVVLPSLRLVSGVV